MTVGSPWEKIRPIWYLVTAIVASLIGVGLASGAEPEGPLARPPKFPPEVIAVFFTDIREHLSGPRPNYSGGAPTSPQSAALSGSGATPATKTGYTWSSLADADTIEAEIKRQVGPLEPLVATPSKFKGGTYRECRDRFNTLAIMFAVSADFDESIRWQDSAGPFSRVFARASANCKVGTDQSFREAQQRVSDLAELVRGGRPSVDAPPGEGDSWEDLVDRTPLMVRMEQALNGAILPNLSSGRDLASHGDDLRHEAQILALLSQVVTQPGLPDAGDESYDAHAHRLRDGAVALVTAIEQDNFSAAKAALGVMNQACAACHDEYR